MPEPAYAQQPVEEVGRKGSLVVRGELDLDAAERLRIDLYRALDHAGDGIELDLRGVPFCDCSGLDLLLNLRQRAIKQGKTVVIRHGGPAVERLLELTGARSLFVPPDQEEPDQEEEDASCPVVHEANPPEGSDEDLRVVVAQLRRAMKTRPTIDLARGILMSTFSLSPEEAWDVLVTASQNTNTKLHLLAGNVVNTVQGAALPAAVRKQLDAAIAKAGAESRASGADPTGGGAGSVSPADPRSA
ncbi:ANTAR domain-containing protein [Streptomyces atriruber]|uniref:ANTAR domain-containing protein n=1 Tax=Streptomyces atriruber TaxID=545121 RepID=UPI0007C86498|nr:ANTAR domain-containing protein [Streptomyces atriruber]